MGDVPRYKRGTARFLAKELISRHTLQKLNAILVAAQQVALDDA
jgi:hypothetical protein